MAHPTIERTTGFLRARWRWIAAVALGLALVALLVLALFPWGMLRQTIADRLSAQLGRPVTIGATERVDTFSLHPVVEMRDIVIPQPDWVEGEPMLRVARARIGFAALPLLFGNFSAETLEVEGADALFVRDADRRTNWSNGKRTRSGAPMGHGLRTLSVRDTRIRYRDAFQDRRFAVAVTADGANGLRITGDGTVHGAAVKVTATGAPMLGKRSDWPFELRIEGPALLFHAKGAAARPLAFDDLTATVTARAIDLAYLDALIEGGLPDTQEVKLRAEVRHAAGVWRVTNIAGTIGRSDLAGEATLRKVDGRNRIEGSLRSKRFDFDDLASDAGLARADAKNAKYGKHVVPDTKIDLSKLGPTDGELRVHVATLLWPGSKPFRSLDATLKLENRKLTAAPLTFGMPHGKMTGRVTIEQVKAGPKLHVALELRDSRLTDLFPNGDVDAAARGKVDVTGIGTTVRAAIGAADGDFALIAEDGALPDKTAILLGQDIGRGIFASKKKQARLRCIVARFRMRGGKATAQNVFLDTSRALTRAQGSISFPAETLAIALEGVPKQDIVIRAEGPVPVSGTIKAPKVGKPDSADSVGDIIGEVAEAIFGNEKEKASDLDCAAAAAKALSF